MVVTWESQGEATGRVVWRKAWTITDEQLADDRGAKGRATKEAI